MTVQGACSTTLAATLPMKNLSRLPMPLWPMKMER